MRVLRLVHLVSCFRWISKAILLGKFFCAGSKASGSGWLLFALVLRPCFWSAVLLASSKACVSALLFVLRVISLMLLVSCFSCGF